MKYTQDRISHVIYCLADNLDMDLTPSQVYKGLCMHQSVSKEGNMSISGMCYTSQRDLNPH